MSSNTRPSLVDQSASAFVAAIIGTLALNIADKKELPFEIAAYGLGGGVLLWLITTFVTWEPFNYAWMVVLPLAIAGGVGITTLGIEAVG